MTDQQIHENDADQHRPGHGRNRAHWLELRVFAPRDPEERVFVFDSSTPVGKAAAQVAEKFGYAVGNHTFQTSDDEVVNRDLTLVGAHIHDHDLLELVDVGGGV